jgi:ATP-binding protein involved in chromosome partitioning
MQRTRLFSTLRVLQHENPLVCGYVLGCLIEINETTQGLPRKGTPPQLPRMRRGLPEKTRIRHVQKIIAVSSAKGGVGKSTLAGTVSLGFH